MHLSPPLRLLARAIASASLILTGLVLPGAVPTAAAASCGTTNIALNKTATASSLENASFPASAAVDGNTCSSPPASTTSTRRSTSPTRTLCCSASASPR